MARSGAVGGEPAWREATAALVRSDRRAVWAWLLYGLLGSVGVVAYTILLGAVAGARPRDPFLVPVALPLGLVLVLVPACAGALFRRAFLKRTKRTLAEGSYTRVGFLGRALQHLEHDEGTWERAAWAVSFAGPVGLDRPDFYLVGLRVDIERGNGPFEVDLVVDVPDALPARCSVFVPPEVVHCSIVFRADWRGERLDLRPETTRLRTEDVFPRRRTHRRRFVVAKVTAGLLLVGATVLALAGIGGLSTAVFLLGLCVAPISGVEWPAPVAPSR